ncbi:MAG TPA: GH3 auxin-responsive promoter family protein [Pyrinomonadaceae bacterium]|nr:GH3 auxin-responsive promoter family protein [Pyrinomonadaceae bacterium]
MRALVNDCLRQIIAWIIIILGLIGSGWQRLRIIAFRASQKRLKRNYRICSNTPVQPYGPEVERAIRNAAQNHVRSASFATTSGSTGKPKQILYTSRRLLALKLTFSDMFARACYAFRLKRTSLYVFNSFETDTSLTSLLLDENRLPKYLSTLQAPYRVQHHPAIRSLVSRYGASAVRLWLLAVSNPGVLYSTNPSTLSTFLDELAANWPDSSKMIKDWCNDPALFSPDVHQIFPRLKSRGCTKRLKQIALSSGPMALSLCAPAVTAYICWTDGYVQPFLERLALHLAAPRYTLIPMYSMSTETIETLPYFRGRDVAFLPIAPGVLYEFLDNAGNLIDIDQLKPDKLYEMVISDAYGLRRYQTDDLFLCRRMVHDLPDLAFVRRRTLEYSFTGEKLTGDQLSAVFEQLRARYPTLLANRLLTCVPAQPPPHYKLLLIGERHSSNHDELAACCDELLSRMNCEYRSKRTSGRLGPIEVVSISMKEFVAQHRTWETQFKFLPLIRESIDPVLI